MSSVYPAGLDSFDTNRTDATPNITTQAADHNDYADAINKIEATLGVDPQGSFSTVVERLDGGGLQVTDFSFTAAQVKASNVHALIAGQPGKIIIPVSGVLVLTFVTTPYPNVVMRFGLAATELLQQSGFMLATSSRVMLIGAMEGASALTNWEGAAFNWTTEFTGPIATTSLSDGGTGYAVNDTGVIDFGNADATYLVTGEAAGVVTTYTITDPGTGYNTVVAANTVTGGGQPGAGSGLTIDIDSVDLSGVAGDGTVSGQMSYLVHTV